MKKILCIIGVAVVMSIASCQKIEEQNPAVETSAAVTFTSEVTTRVADTTWETGDEIGVFMYELDDNVYDRYGTNALYYISSGAETTSAKFTSDNPLYYPQNAHMDFVAYYPYAEDTESSVAFTVGSTDQSSEEKLKALDLMVARAGNCPEGSSPTLSFERKMSKVVFEVSRKDTAKELIDFTLSNVISGGTYIIYNTSSAKWTTVTAGTTKESISLFMSDSEKVEAIVVPQDATDAKIAVSFGGNTYYGTFSDTFEAGMQYTYTLIVGQTEVTLSEVTINDWGYEEENGELELNNVSDISYNTLTSTYEIATSNGMRAFADLVNGSACSVSDLTFDGDESYFNFGQENLAINGKLRADIDLGGIDADGNGIAENAFTAICSSRSRTYGGIFDGNGYEISGLYISSTDDYQGLFGYVQGATIKNLSVSGSVTGATYVGGIVGYSESSTITYCHNSATITGTSYSNGGIVGKTYGDSIVSYCSNSATITGESNYVGGIVGFISTTLIDECSNTGNVNGPGYGIGGVVGQSDGATLVDCSNAGTVTGAVTTSGYHVGGIMGYSSSGATITRCVNTGSVVTSTYDVGGI